MRYFVVAEDGNKYGPADVATLNSWIQESRIVPGTLLEDESSGARIAAASVPGLVFISTPPSSSGQSGPGGPPQPGAAYDFSQPPGAQGPYTGSSFGYQAPPGKTETLFAWIMAGLSVLFVCCGIGWIFNIVGIVLSVVGKNKGNPNASAALAINVVVLVVTLILSLFLLPSLVKGFQTGYQGAMRGQ